ncbi:MAG TPA: glycosyltransferase 87 family protein [Acidimicrobiales bacterium]|jgi:alpha-1,2-mannosyltransferase
MAAWLVDMARQQQVDFEVYRLGGQHVFGSGLYTSSVRYETSHLPFTYPPLSALLFWPVSHLSTFAGGLVWDAVDLTALTALIAVSIAAAKGRKLVSSDWRTALLLLIPLGLLLFPVRQDLELGQINALLVLMIVADLAVGVSWRGKTLPKGVLTGLAAALKLTPLVFLPYLLATRQWRAARNMVTSFVAATAAMFVIAPGASWLYFTKDVFEVKRIGNAGLVIDQTLRAAIGRAGFSPSHAVGDLITVAVVCGGITLAVQAYRRSSAFLGVLVCAATGLLVSPISWLHHYVWILPALVWLVVGRDRPAKGVYWAAVAALPFMAVPPTPAGEVNAIWYLRENAYVLSTVVFLGLIGAMLWFRSRTPDRSTAEAPEDELRSGRREPVLTARGEQGG